MKCYVTIFLILFLSISCKKENEKSLNKNQETKDTLYSKKWLETKLGENEKAGIEIYTSNFKDTISNQLIVYNHNIIDTTKSRFYNLKIKKTSKPNVYKASIQYFSGLHKTKSKKGKNIYLLFYREVSKDSTYLSKKRIENAENVEFEFLNVKSSFITGVLVKTVNFDTIVKGIKMVRILEDEILFSNKNGGNEKYFVPNSYKKEKNYSVNRK